MHFPLLDREKLVETVYASIPKDYDLVLKSHPHLRKDPSIEKIANGNKDRPVLMVALNKYFEGEYPNGSIYKDYMKALDALLGQIGARIIWRTPVYGQPIGTQDLDEILCAWYPSHKAFLASKDQGQISEEKEKTAKRF